MQPWTWFIAGAVVGGTVCFALGQLLVRRVWRTARRIAARSKGRQQLVELGQLTGGLAHEIKNPLSTINMNLKLLAEDLADSPLPDTERWRRRLESVRAEVDRVREILDDFLRFAGKYELTPEPVDLRRLVEDVTDFFAPQAEAARIVMRPSLSDQEVPVHVDANLIKQALLNLMINALQAMDEGGELMVRVSSTRRHAILEVIDTGPGADAETLAQMFQPYFSTKDRGTGLGLPTTRRIVREHGGTVRVESEPGKGTRFTISLPLEK